jgi:hypothetical protein
MALSLMRSESTQRDLSAVRRLIERDIPVDLETLMDPSKSFAAMLMVEAQS